MSFGPREPGAAPGVVGIDIGGTKIAAAFITSDGLVLERQQCPTPARDGALAVLDAVASLAADVAARAPGPAAAFGVGAAGAFDKAGRVVHATDHLPGWAGTDVARELSTRVRAPVAVINDVHAAALGEHLHGHKRADSTLFVAVGTGIGGAFVTSGRVLPGRSGMGGSVGHVRIPTSEHRTCSCGGVDHIEAFASGPGIELSFFQTTGRRLRLPEINKLASRDDRVAADVIRSSSAQLGRSLAGAVTIFNPSVVIVGGGVAQLADTFVAPLASALRSELRPPFADVEITLTTLDENATLLGAAHAARTLLTSGSIKDCFL